MEKSEEQRDQRKKRDKNLGSSSKENKARNSKIG